ncbi:CRISPR-associated helicase/endonuclease Cas3 [Zobellella taiwanensis]|uniref:CRISPR-associated helicase/endonuclease Cas3 n=1 Tax=Zobellella taiwanensis TaxID=347535 RepID=A0A2P7R9Q1_9GAMM|nr:CRISPR-associated helicase/endonuclease Cas3 [Zobellella taiwanensis]PSJ46954.1 CRISPR-associated helicase/endonuclease Cas3 [Zobellella taiwanensis]
MRASYFRYWGKARKDDQQPGEDYHLLPYHCLDVAACGWVLLSDDYPWVKTLAEELGVTPDQLRRIFIFFLCLHDIGKFARTFQGQVTGLSLALVAAIKGMVYNERHDSLGFWLWRDAEKLHTAFAEFFGLTPQQVRVNAQLRIWFEVTTGHHGQPPKLKSQLLSEHFDRSDIEAACDFVREMLAMWLQPEDIHILQDKELIQKLKARSWTLAGLAVLADWQGSNQTYFRYCAKAMPLLEYWKTYALPRARKAVQHASIMPHQAMPFGTLQQLFPFIQQPTPLQCYAIEQPILNEPQLFILEDVTGAGKTEAAMVLIHRLMAQGLADGLYVGLPTMATANAMYLRMAECYQHLYQPGQPVSLVLAHGARHLSEAFLQSVADQPKDHCYHKEELSASAYCNSWIADSRKKALLADIGVGTIDQALQGILPSRHQSLRLLGLGRKVLLVDEVHAYDPYMRTLLACLLEMHARQGGCAILLSATLPQQMKEQLMAAYAQGRGLVAPILNKNDYPLATHFPILATHAETHVPTRMEVQRKVRVQRVSDSEQAYALIRKAVKEERCVCWIRNTVDDARHSYDILCQKLRAVTPNVHLFHSRFAMVDRQKIEGEVLEWFGKKSGHQQRKGRVLVSTQVVEQSLDLDFDVLITDLAPIDLLLQRAGRLHRHVRDVTGNILSQGSKEQRPPATLYVLSPEPTEEADDQWLATLSGTLAVYRDMGQLWRSAKVLLECGGYAMPEDARNLIEAVYSPDTPLITPTKLEELSFEADGKRRAEASMANFNKLELAAGYSQKSSDAGWSEEVNIPTRLSDKTVSVVLVKPATDGGWQPYAEHPRFGWDLSTLQMRETLWQEADKAISPSLKEQMEQLRARIPALKWHALFPLVGDLSDFYHSERGWLGNKGEAQ